MHTGRKETQQSDHYVCERVLSLFFVLIEFARRMKLLFSMLRDFFPLSPHSYSFLLAARYSTTTAMQKDERNICLNMFFVAVFLLLYPQSIGVVCLSDEQENAFVLRPWFIRNN